MQTASVLHVIGPCAPEDCVGADEDMFAFCWTFSDDRFEKDLRIFCSFDTRVDLERRKRFMISGNYPESINLSY